MSSEKVLKKPRFFDVWIFPPTEPLVWIRQVGAALGGLLRIWGERFRQRDELAELEPRMLRDIGVTEEQARRESRTPFWID